MSPQHDERFLFIGAGGMGMAPLACWMSSAGYSISGYDACLHENVRKHLVAAGVELRDFVFPEQVGGFTTIVYTSALRQDHPLLEAARAVGLACVRRGEMLARLAADRNLIAIVGSHGKTTTAGMVAWGIRKSGLEANYISGGLFNDDSIPPGHYSESPLLVAEVDESDGTIEAFNPEHSLILNLDWDHADHYEEASDLEAAFMELAQRTRQAVLMPEGMRMPGMDETKRVSYSVPQGQGFNAANAAAAMALLNHLQPGLPDSILEDFPGIARRQTVRFDEEDLTVVEDYAHHPTEIAALICSLRELAGGRQLLVVFQPHRFSRTRQFKEDFAQALSQADACYLLPVYAAHEARLEGGDIDDLAGAFSDSKPVVLEAALPDMKRVVAEARAKPTLLAFVGAGDIEDVAAASAALLREPESSDVAFLDFLSRRLSPEAVVRQAEPLANKTTMRIGGPARLYAEPASFADLQNLLRAAALFELKYFCIGRGSNLLVADEGFDGLVIRFSAENWRKVEALGEDRIWAAAGGRLKEICGFAAKAGLAGFEFLEGIPGAVGGALRMNAGAMGSWMFDVVERVQFIDENGVYRDWPKELFHFGYRRVEEISRGIALGAILRCPEREEEAAIRDRIDSYSATRKESQPRGPSAGCIFKNPDGSFAGKLIDEHGLKGLRVGEAEVSDVHGNFIVNQGGATAKDVIELVRQIRAKVKAESGYVLEPEVLLVGREWSDVLEEAADG